MNAPAQYGRSVLAVALYLHLYQLWPLARAAATRGDWFGCQLSPATIQRAVRDLAQTLVPAEQRLKAALSAAAVLGVDETGRRVGGALGYVHVARTEELTHYAYDSRRGKAAMDEIGVLPRFQGTLVRDGFSSYRAYQQCQHSLCNAHLLRDLIFIGESCPPHKTWTEPLAQLLRDIKQAADHAPNGLNQQRQAAFRQRYEQLLAQAETIPPPAPARPVNTQLKPHTLIKRLRQWSPEILRFMSDPKVPFDNNGSERDLRMIKLQQKISGCFRTPNGARRFCRVRSYLATARKQGYSLLQALQRALHGKPLPLHLVNARSQPAPT